MQSKLLASIIVPIYNVEKYLDECVQSLVSQTYENLEILLIDDGTKDRSGELADRWAEKDERIRVIHQGNQGLSGARNTGLREAKGEYIFFVDSDDYVTEKYVEELVLTMEKENADVAMCSFVSVWKDGVGNLRLWAEKQVVMDGERYSEAFYFNKQLFVVVWNKGYRRSLFENVTYDVGKLNEDARILLKLWPKINKAVYIPQGLYFYRQRRSGIMNGTGKEKLLQSEWEWNRMHLEYHQQRKNVHLYMLALKMYFYQAFWYYSDMGVKARKNVRRELRRVTGELIRYKGFRFKVKLKMALCCLFPMQYSKYKTSHNKKAHSECFD